MKSNDSCLRKAVGEAVEWASPLLIPGYKPDR